MVEGGRLEVRFQQGSWRGSAKPSSRAWTLLDLKLELKVWTSGSGSGSGPWPVKFPKAWQELTYILLVDSEVEVELLTAGRD